jgi:hypothetical protein
MTLDATSDAGDVYEREWGKRDRREEVTEYLATLYLEIRALPEAAKS